MLETTPNAIFPDTPTAVFQSAMRLGAGNVGPKPLKAYNNRVRSLTSETLQASLELKTMPPGLSRLLVVVSESTKFCRIEDLLDNIAVTPGVMAGASKISKVVLKRAHEVVPLFKKNDDHQLRPVLNVMDAAGKICCSILSFSLYDAGGLRSLRPVLLGEAMVNIDMLCLKGLIEQNYFEDAKPSKDVLPLFSGSIELVKENNVVIVVVVFMFSFSFYFFFFSDDWGFALLLQSSSHWPKVSYFASCDPTSLHSRVAPAVRQGPNFHFGWKERTKGKGWSWCCCYCCCSRSFQGFWSFLYVASERY